MKDMLERFWTKVDDRGGPDACWPWVGARSRGYGALYVARLPDRPTMETAHRIAYELHHREPIPPELTVDHLCRVRHCVNLGGASGRSSFAASSARRPAARCSMSSFR
jgi:hypothetical protein